jgi:hypothetical protein
VARRQPLEVVLPAGHLPLCIEAVVLEGGEDPAGGRRGSGGGITRWSGARRARIVGSGA